MSRPGHTELEAELTLARGTIAELTVKLTERSEVMHALRQDVARLRQSNANLLGTLAASGISKTMAEEVDEKVRSGLGYQQAVQVALNQKRLDASEKELVPGQTSK